MLVLIYTVHLNNFTKCLGNGTYRALKNYTQCGDTYIYSSPRNYAKALCTEIYRTSNESCIGSDLHAVDPSLWVLISVLTVYHTNYVKHTDNDIYIYNASRVLHRRVGVSTFWYGDVSVLLSLGLSTFRFVDGFWGCFFFDISVYGHFNLSKFWFVDISVPQRFGCRRFGLPTFRSFIMLLIKTSTNRKVDNQIDGKPNHFDNQTRFGF